jgi:hypothetical protein
MTDTIETSDDGRYRVRLMPDPEPSNPRTEFDQLTHVITLPTHQYIDVDRDGGPLEDGWERIMGHPDAVEIFTRWARIFHGAVVEYHAPHDGAEALWYLMPDGIAQVPDPVAAIRGEIDEYMAWARGEVYGYVIEKAVTWQPVDPGDDVTLPDEHTSWVEVNDGSCWGLIGYDYAETEAREQFAAFLEDKQS